MPAVQNIALLANCVAFSFTALFAKDHLAFDQTRRHAQLSQLRLDTVFQRNVVVLGHLAARGIDNARGDGEGPRGRDASTGKVHVVQLLEIVNDGLGGAVRQQHANIAGEVARELLDTRRDGLLGRLAEGLGHELRLAEEDAAVAELVADVLEVVVAHVVDAEDEAVLVLGDGVADVAEELVLVLARLLGDLREVEDLCTLGLGHCGGFLGLLCVYIKEG